MYPKPPKQPEYYHNYEPRNNYAGFNYELWLRRGHEGTVDDYLEWLRAGADNIPENSIDYDKLTEDARARLEANYLAIANERHYGSREWSGTRRIQGLCTFTRQEGGAEQEYMVFATVLSGNVNTMMHLYKFTRNSSKDPTSDTLLHEFEVYVPDDDGDGDENKNKAWNGHYNDMTYCTKDDRIYVANYTNPRIEVFLINADHQLVWERYVDMEAVLANIGIADTGRSDYGCVHSIGWSEKEQCFYLGFLDISSSRHTWGLFRFEYGFAKAKQIAVDYSNYSRQCMCIERETGNIMQVKFRQKRSFPFPPGNRVQTYSPDGRLIAVTYLDSEFEIEGIGELANGMLMFAYGLSRAAGGTTKRATIFTLGAISSAQNAKLYSTYSKYYLNSSDYNRHTNNIYYKENPPETKLAEGGSKANPIKAWPAILNLLTTNTTEILHLHLLSDLTWPVNLTFFSSQLRFTGEEEDPQAVLEEVEVPIYDDVPDDDDEYDPDDKPDEDLEEEAEEETQLRSMPCVELYGCRQDITFSTVAVGATYLRLTFNQRVYFDHCEVSAENGAAWTDNFGIHFTECDLSGVEGIDLLRTRLVLLDQPMVYGASTRFSGVGTSYRIYGDTTPEEQFALRGGTSAASNISCVGLSKISDIRMNMNINVSAPTAGQLADLPHYIRNGDNNSRTATCSTAAATAAKTATIAGYSLTDGITAMIKFTYGNTADSPTLNISSTGDIPLDIGTWTDGEAVVVRYVSETDGVGKYQRYGMAFSGRAEVLSNDKMLYVITEGGEEYRRIVTFASSSRTITDDSGWMTRDNELFPLNTAVMFEARADKWKGGNIVLLGDSIAASQSPAWIEAVETATGATATNVAVGSAGFTISGNTIEAQITTAGDAALAAADVIIVAAGTNDAANSSAAGATLRAAVQNVIDGLKAKSNAPIVFITPLRRGRDVSGGTGTVAYSRLRLVAAAICNVALINGCSVINGFDFPIAVSGSEWVTEMTNYDGLHPATAGKNVYSNCVLQALGHAPRGSRTYYAVCTTASSTAAKVATTVNGDFVLEKGAMLRVYFESSNTATGEMTLDVDGTGAKTVKNIGTTTTRFVWRNSEDVDLTYDGESYTIEGKGAASTARYGITMLSDAADSTGNTTALAPNALAYPMRYIITGASIYSEDTSYSAGDRARKGYYLYEANKTTTGTWKAADWDVVDPLQTQIDALEARVAALEGS